MLIMNYNNITLEIYFNFFTLHTTAIFFHLATYQALPYLFVSKKAISGHNHCKVNKIHVIKK